MCKKFTFCRLRHIVHLQTQFIGNHGDELAVRGLAPRIVNGITEIRIQNIHITAIPSDFDRMANGAFHTGARGLVLLCHTRIKLFCHRIDNLRVFDGHDDGIPKIVVSLNVGRHANLVQDLRDLNAQVAAAGAV